MARSKARVEFLLNVIGILFYLLRLRRYKAKGVKTRCYQEWVGQFEPRFQGKGTSLGNIYWFLYKARHILLSDSANCTVLRAVVLTQYRRVTDGQTHRRNCRSYLYSTALGMRALRRAVKTRINLQGSPKLVNRSQPLVDRSSPYCEDVLLFNKFLFRLSIRVLVAKI